MHLTCLFFLLALDSRDPGPLSSTYRFFHPSNPAPLADHDSARPSFALWTRILLCLRFLSFFFPSVTLLGVWSRSENFFFSRTLIDDTWVIDVWPDSSVNFLRFLTVVGLIYFNWWIYFSFFFLGKRKKVNWIACKLFPIFDLYPACR